MKWLVAQEYRQPVWYVDAALGGDCVRADHGPDCVISVAGQPDCTITASLSSREAKRSAGSTRPPHAWSTPSRMSATPHQEF